MVEWVRNRAVSFEIFHFVEDRWRLECICPDEKTALADARAALGAARAVAVRVVRLRTMSNGCTTETVIYEDRREPLKEKPLQVREPADAGTVCADIDEVFAPAGRRVVSDVLRDYLGRNEITATELLHGWSHLRRLQDKAGMAAAALHRVASAQMRGTGGEVRARIQQLDRLHEGIQGLARDFAAERKGLPAFLGTGLQAYSEQLGGAVGPERAGYALRSQLAAWLFDHRTLSGKLEAVVSLADEEMEAGLLHLLDGVAADCLQQSQVIQDLFGAQPSLGAWLALLADLLQGRTDGLGGDANPVLRALIGRVRAGMWPQCGEMLTRWLLRELAGDRPLDRLNPQNEGCLLEELVRRLTDAEGQVFGGRLVEEAVAKRRLRQRQTLLRAQGLGSIADNLRA